MEEKSKTGKEWAPFKNDGTTEDTAVFLDLLKKANLDDELAAEVATQVREAGGEKHNILFVFTEGTYAVTAVHTSRDALDGKDGPVLMRGANERSIIAAYAADYIENLIDKADKLEEETGLPGFGDTAWMNELEKMADRIKLEMKLNPPASWDDLLKEEDK